VNTGFTLLPKRKLTACRVEELTSTVRQNADNAQQSNNLAIAASELAGEGGAVVARVIETMGAIDASSHGQDRHHKRLLAFPKQFQPQRRRHGNGSLEVTKIGPSFERRYDAWYAQWMDIAVYRRLQCFMLSLACLSGLLGQYVYRLRDLVGLRK
jgi:hypothetical protein